MRGYIPALAVAVSLLPVAAPSAADRVAGDRVAADDSTVSVTEVSAADFEKALKSHKGKVVLVDCWATWCVPCVKKFPLHVERHKKYADKGLVCVSLSVDKYNEQVYDRAAVLKFLTEKGATFPNFIVADKKKDEEAFVELLAGDFYAVPYMVMFDRNGRKVWTSEEKPKLSDEQLDKLIEAELAKK